MCHLSLLHITICQELRQSCVDLVGRGGAGGALRGEDSGYGRKPVQVQFGSGWILDGISWVFV